MAFIKIMSVAAMRTGQGLDEASIQHLNLLKTGGEEPEAGEAFLGGMTLFQTHATLNQILSCAMGFRGMKGSACSGADCCSCLGQPAGGGDQNTVQGVSGPAENVRV